MTATELLNLIRSWRAGDCPGEVLLDAISEYGIDVGYGKPGSRRFFPIVYLHLKGKLACTSLHQRKTCAAVKWVEKQLKDS